MFMMISRDLVPAFARQATALEAPLGMERRQLNLETCARRTAGYISRTYSQSQIHVIPAIFCHQNSRTVSVVIGCDSISLLRRFALGKATQVSCGPIPHDP